MQRRGAALHGAMARLAVLAALQLLCLAAGAPETASVFGMTAEDAEEFIPQVAAEDGSVCFNGCNGHGDCRDYVCYCYDGWHGDDCRYSFVDSALSPDLVASGARSDVLVRPILSVGNANITSAADFGRLCAAVKKRYPGRGKRRKRKPKKGAEDDGEGAADFALAEYANREWFLVGISSRSCHKCIRAENVYASMGEDLEAMGVPLLRMDVGDPALRHLGEKWGLNSAAGDLPAMLLFRRGQLHATYAGAKTAAAMLAYVRKQLRPEPFVPLGSREAAVSFLLGGGEMEHVGVVSTAVVAVFADAGGVEEDEYEEFLEAAEALRSRHDVYVGLVTAPAAVAAMKAGFVDRSPSLVLRRSSARGGEATFGGGAGAGSGGRVVAAAGADGVEGALVATFEELSWAEQDEASVVGWVSRNALPSLGRLSPANFKMYERLRLPMLLLFLDLRAEDDHGAADVRAVRGESGGIANGALLAEMQAVAEQHRGRVFFCYCDGVAQKDQMKALGITKGTSSLPALAWNTLDGTKVPFSEELPLNRDTIGQFVADFLSGRLRSREEAEEMARKQLLPSRALNMHNMPVRRPLPPAPEVVAGVSERFSSDGADHVLPVTAASWDRLVMDEAYDTVVLFHEENCQPCAHIAPYYRRVGRRFHEESLQSVRVARFDLSDEAPPPHARVSLMALPFIALFPAYEKGTPLYYSGVGKVKEVMEWVAAHAGHRIALPALPHLDATQREQYRQQVVEREVMRAKRAQQDAEEMRAEDERRAADAQRRARRAGEL